MRATYVPREFEAVLQPERIDFGSRKTRKRCIEEFLKPLTADAQESDYLFYAPVGNSRIGTSVTVWRVIFSSGQRRMRNRYASAFLRRSTVTKLRARALS